MPGKPPNGESAVDLERVIPCDNVGQTAGTCWGSKKAARKSGLSAFIFGLDRARFGPVVAYSDRWGPVGDRLRAAGTPVHRIPVRQPPLAEQAIREIASDIFHSFSHRRAEDVLAARAAGVRVIITSRVAFLGLSWEAVARDPPLLVRPFGIS